MTLLSRLDLYEIAAAVCFVGCMVVIFVGLLVVGPALVTP